MTRWRSQALTLMASMAMPAQPSTCAQQSADGVDARTRRHAPQQLALMDECCASAARTSVLRAATNASACCRLSMAPAISGASAGRSGEGGQGSASQYAVHERDGRTGNLVDLEGNDFRAARAQLHGRCLLESAGDKVQILA